MTTGATGQLGLALPVQGELSGTWGDTVNNGITQYTNIAIAATLTLTNDGAVTLANTTGDASASNITSTLTGAGTVTAQFAIVRVTGTLTTAKVVTAPSYSKTYTVVNAATGGIVTFKASGQTGVSIAVGESAFVYYNGTDYVKVSGTSAVSSFSAGTTGFTPSTATTGAVTLAGTLATTNGGTGLTSFTSGGVVYASSSSALATGSALTFDGTNLGVGTSSPQAKLEVKDGYARIYHAAASDLAGYGIEFSTNGGGTDTTIASIIPEQTGSSVRTGALVFYTANAGAPSEKMRLTNAGSLGIGTSSPATTLQLNGSAAFGNVNGTGTVANGWSVSNTSASNSFYFAQDNSTGNNFNTGTAYGPVIWTNASSMTFVTDSGSNVMKYSSGNLGIGTSSPSAKLEVSGALGQSVFGEAARFVSTNIDSGTKITFYGKQGSDASAKLSGAIGFNQTNNNDSDGRPAFIIQTGNNGTITEKVRVTYDGNLLVGSTANPGTRKLSVNGIISVQDGTTEQAFIYYTGSVTQWVSSSTPMTFYVNGAERARLSNAGGFSVGTTADPGVGAIYATGNITAYYSDARLKTVSGKIENALDKVAQLSGVYYTNNSVAKSFGYDSDEVQVGVLAQDVEAVLPQIVKAAPFDLDADGNSKSGENYKTVQYERLVPLLIEAINELQAKVKALESK